MGRVQIGFKLGSNRVGEFGDFPFESITSGVRFPEKTFYCNLPAEQTPAASPPAPPSFEDHYAVTDFENNPEISIKPLFCLENLYENAVTDKDLTGKFAAGMVETGVMMATGSRLRLLLLEIKGGNAMSLAGYLSQGKGNPELRMPDGSADAVGAEYVGMCFPDGFPRSRVVGGFGGLAGGVAAEVGATDWASGLGSGLFGCG